MKSALRKIVYLVGYNNVKNTLQELDKDNLTMKERKEILIQKYGHIADLSKLQPRSWYYKFGLKHCKPKQVSYRQDVELLLEKLGNVSLKDYLFELYIEKEKSSGDISKIITKEFDIEVTPAQVQNWLKLCEIPVRTTKEHVRLRWDKPEERQKAAEKTRQFFQTPEGEKVRIKLSKWNAEVWGKKYAVSKLERLFAEQFLIGINYKCQKQFVLPNKKRVVADFYVDGKVIEIQGDYWHWNPSIYHDEPEDIRVIKTLQRDKLKQQFYKERGIPVLYIWEYDIKHNPDYVREILKEFLFEHYQ